MIMTYTAGNYNQFNWYTLSKEKEMGWGRNGKKKVHNNLTK